MKYCGNNKPACKPVEAIIRATSPLLTIPEPIISEDLELNPVKRAPSHPPNNLVTHAIIVITIKNPHC
ncbi:hypothetical protein D3C71_2244540 [compost metagenome]